jgi:DNA polymerase IV
MAIFGYPASVPDWPRAIHHPDIDVLYVNGHLLDAPKDVGLPLVVGGRPHEQGVVASASYEVRWLGIHSARPTSTAVRRGCRSLASV